MPVRSPGVAFANALQAQPGPLQHAPFLNSAHHIMRAGGLKPAARPDERGNRVLVETDGKNKQMFHEQETLQCPRIVYSRTGQAILPLESSIRPDNENHQTADLADHRSWCCTMLRGFPKVDRRCCLLHRSNVCLFRQFA